MWMHVIFVLIALASGMLWGKIEPPVLKKGVPDKKVVMQGETIEDLARIFLINPWRWKEAWGSAMAPRKVIAGDKIVVVHSKKEAPILVYQPAKRVSGKKVLVTLGPQVLATPLPPMQAYKTRSILPFVSVSGFLKHGHIFSNHGAIERLPKIRFDNTVRIFSIKGSIGYSNMKPTTVGTLFSVYRPGKVYKAIKEKEYIIGINSNYIGRVRVNAYNDGIARFVVEDIWQGMKSGDVLMPVGIQKSTHDFVLTSGASISKIISPVGDIRLSGLYASVVIAGGTNVHRKRGQLFSIYKHVAKKRSLALSFIDKNRPIAQVMVYAVFDKASYALILEASDSVEKGDVLKPFLLSEAQK